MNYFTCQACNIEYEYISELNKHLLICVEYDDWIKTYIPPKIETCQKCERHFIINTNHSCGELDNTHE